MVQLAVRLTESLIGRRGRLKPSSSWCSGSREAKGGKMGGRPGVMPIGVWTLCRGQCLCCIYCSPTSLADWCTDYRCDDRRFWLSAQKLSSPNPNVSKPRTRTANSDFWSWLTQQLPGRLKSTIPNLQIYFSKKKGEFWEVGVGDWQYMQDSYFEFADEQVLGEGYWPTFLESWSRQLCNDTKMSPQLKSFSFVFHRPIQGYQIESLLIRFNFWSTCCRNLLIRLNTKVHQPSWKKIGHQENGQFS